MRGGLSGRKWGAGERLRWTQRGEKKKAPTESIDKCLEISGAGYAIRTRDFQLGKLTLYH